MPVRRPKMRQNKKVERLSDSSGSESALPNTIHAGQRDLQRHETLMCCRDRAGKINRAAGILDHNDIEAFAARVLGGETHAIVEGKPRQEDPPEAAIAQIAGKPGLG